jgi:hypothetical protein
MAADETGRRDLTETEQALSTDDLVAYLKRKGYSISRSTAWRAKNSGYFFPGYKPNQGRQVFLTPEERLASVEFLAERFNIRPNTARKAKLRGWFVSQAGHNTAPADRFVPETQQTAEAVMRAVVLTPEERQAFPEFLAERFGVSVRIAATARKHGLLKIIPAIRGKVKIPKDRSMPSVFPGQTVLLTTEEKKLKQVDLVDRFGIHRTTAATAKKTGFFTVMPHNVDTVKVPVNRVVEPEMLVRRRRPRP